MIGLNYFKESMTMAKEKDNLMEKIVSLCKRRGFIYPASEIYGGFANAFDYGPLGSQMKKNLKDEWWKKFVLERDDIVGLDSAIIQNPKTWEASGHLSSFSDPMVECKKCHNRFRLDKLLEEISGLTLDEAYHTFLVEWWNDLKSRLDQTKESANEETKILAKEAEKIREEMVKEGVSKKEIKHSDAEFKEKHLLEYSFTSFDSLHAETQEFIRISKEGISSYLEYLVSTFRLVCSSCGNREFTHPKDFNLMFKTYVGPMEDSSSIAYLRPETAQGIFLNFKNVMQSTRVKIPFGIAQIGKAFRNEITPGNFTFRTREFEQGEIEFFIKPISSESEKWYKKWLGLWKDFFIDLSLTEKKLTIREHAKEELSHYSSGTSDLEYKFPFGVSELAGVAQRTDFDLKSHQDKSGQDLRFFDEQTGERYTPFVVEPTMGIDRATLAFLVDAYDESDGKDGREKGEVTLRLNPKLAPIKVAVFPLVKKEGLPDIAQGIIRELRKSGIASYYDESGSVGRRYRRQDEIGTPWCITVDFDSLKDGAVTVRDRDSMKQERIKTIDVLSYIEKELQK